MARKHKYHKPGLEGDPDFMTFPVLACLAKKPYSARELSRELLISRQAVYRRLRKLKEQNMVVQRMDDGRWVPIVRLVVERPQDQVSDSPGPRTPFVQNGQEGPQEPAGEDKWSAPTPHRPEEKTEYNPPNRPTTASEQSQRVSKHFRVPIRFKGKEVGVGKIELCDACKRPTPLKYGNIPLCPICSREKR